MAQQLRPLVYREPGFDSKPSQPFITPVSGDLKPFSKFQKHQPCKWYTYIHVGKTLNIFLKTKKKKLNLILKKGSDSMDAYPYVEDVDGSLLKSLTCIFIATKFLIL